MNLIITFGIAYVITTIVYYLWYNSRNNMDDKEYLKRVLLFALAIGVMFGAMYYFTDELDIFVHSVVFVTIVLVTDNVMIHTYFPKGTLDTKKVDYFLPGIINTVLIFAALYFAIFQ